MKYCTYFTSYRGNKLPPFYIGYSTVENVMNGYHGSVASKAYRLIWKKEERENPHLFHTRILNVYETVEEAKDRETYLQRSLSAIKNPLYVNMRIFGRGGAVVHTEETKRLISRKLKGVPQEWKSGDANPAKRPEVRAKISASLTGKKLSQSRRDQMSAAMKGDKNPAKSAEARAKISAAKKGDPCYAKGMKWYNNGVKSGRFNECPEGWILGRLYKGWNKRT